MEFSKDLSILLSGSVDKSIKLTNMASKKFICALNGHTNTVTSVKMSSNMNVVGSTSGDKTVKIWDASTKKCTATFYDHFDKVNELSLLLDKEIVSCGDDGNVNLFDLRTNILVQHYEAHANTATSVIFSNSGNYIVSSGGDGTVKVWDRRAGQLLYTLNGHEDSVLGVGLSKDDGLIASCDSLGHVLVWQSNFSSVEDKRFLLNSEDENNYWESNEEKNECDRGEV